MGKENPQIAPAMSDEQGQDFAALSAIAAEEVQYGAPEPEPVVDEAAAWAVLPAMVGGMLKMAFPELDRVYSPEACHAWGAAMVPVAKKYGWDVEGVLSVELVAVAATVPFILGTAQAIQAAKARAAQEKPAKVVYSHADPVPAPVSGNVKAVQFGTVAPAAEVGPAEA